MNILQLRYAVEVGRTGSISMAAKNLYMNQPNLSKAIRELEEDLGVVIFERTAKGVVPTERGRQVLDYAQSILGQVSEMETLFKPAVEHRARFDICVPRASYVSRALAAFVEALGPEDMLVDYRETSSMRAIKYVAGGIHNLAVVRYQTVYEAYFLNALAERSLQYELVWEFSHVALMSRRHPLAGMDAVEPADLLVFTEIVHGDVFVPSLPVAEARRLAQETEKRSTVTVYERASQLELLSRIPTTYMWVSPTPKDALERFRLVQKPCKAPQNVCRDILVARAGYRYSKEDSLFLRALREAVREVSQP